MDRRIGRIRIALVTGLVVLGLTAFTGGVSASPDITPTGHTGSCNMLAAAGAGDRGGIVNAWSQADANGVAGMFWAADVTGTPLCVE